MVLRDVIAVKSSTVSIGANLNDATPISTGAATYNAVTKNMAMYAVDDTTGIKPDFEMQVPVSDSKGGRRTLTISVLRSDVPNTWFAEVRGETTEMSAAGNPNGLISSGLLKFNTDGSLDMTNSTIFGAAGATSLTISGSQTDINATLSSLKYTGDKDLNGTAADTLSVVAKDSTGATSSVKTVTIDIPSVFSDFGDILAESISHSDTKLHRISKFCFCIVCLEINNWHRDVLVDEEVRCGESIFRNIACIYLEPTRIFENN